jgi:hypothetical protein
LIGVRNACLTLARRNVPDPADDACGGIFISDISYYFRAAKQLPDSETTLTLLA